MSLADTNLVIAVIRERDALKERAETWLRRNPVPTVPYSVGLELLLIAKKRGFTRVGILGAACRRLRMERLDVLLAAAEMLDTGEVSGTFDAVHLAEAMHAETTLVTADEALWKMGNVKQF